ncbi:hypothetical protein NL676_007086 [Syzygium grande]|nr:hypothetical protein NL676_007086 [Syzygium grande]
MERVRPEVSPKRFPPPPMERVRPIVSPQRLHSLLTLGTVRDREIWTLSDLTTRESTSEPQPHRGIQPQNRQKLVLPRKRRYLQERDRGRERGAPSPNEQGAPRSGRHRRHPGGKTQQKDRGGSFLGQICPLILGRLLLGGGGDRRIMCPNAHVAAVFSSTFKDGLKRITMDERERAPSLERERRSRVGNALAWSKRGLGKEQFASAAVEEEESGRTLMAI